MLKTGISLSDKTVLITGAAGFIGANLMMELLRTVPRVYIVGFDNMNDYYDVSIKDYRLKEIGESAARHPDCAWMFVRGDLSNRSLVDELF